MTKPQATARAKALDGRMILQTAATLLLLAALVLWGAGRAGAAGADEAEPGVLAHNAEVKDAGVEITIGTNLTADDGSGNTATWVFSYDAEGEPTHLTVKVQAPFAAGPVTYSTKLDAADVDNLVQWLYVVKANIDASPVR